MKLDKRMIALERTVIALTLARYREWSKDYPEGIWPRKKSGAPQGLARKLLLAAKKLYDYKHKGKRK